MTVVYYDNIEYSGIIQNVVETLSEMEKYVLRIWVDGTEVPYLIFGDDEIEFLHESVKITTVEDRTRKITWILYGIIMSFEVTTNVAP